GGGSFWRSFGEDLASRLPAGGGGGPLFRDRRGVLSLGRGCLDLFARPSRAVGPCFVPGPWHDRGPHDGGDRPFGGLDGGLGGVRHGLIPGGDELLVDCGASGFSPGAPSW